MYYVWRTYYTGSSDTLIQNDLPPTKVLFRNYNIDEVALHVLTTRTQLAKSQSSALSGLVLEDADPILNYGDALGVVAGKACTAQTSYFSICPAAAKAERPPSFCFSKGRLPVTAAPDWSMWALVETTHTGRVDGDPILSPPSAGAGRQGDSEGCNDGVGVLHWSERLRPTRRIV